jgi:hypothetical protein
MSAANLKFCIFLCIHFLWTAYYAMDLPTSLHDSLIMVGGGGGTPDPRFFATKLMFARTEMQLQQFIVVDVRESN